MVEWLNTAFQNFDLSILRAVAKSSCSFLTAIATFFTFIGESSMIEIIISVILLLFKKTRKLGLTLFCTVVFSTLFTKFILKEIFFRERPFLAYPEINAFWQRVGEYPENSSSFPSGHSTESLAFGLVLFIMCDKKWSWTGFVFALLTGLSRIYLMAHYPTDVICGYIIGAVSGVLAFYTAKLCYFILEKLSKYAFFRFFLEADIKDLFTKKQEDKN